LTLGKRRPRRIPLAVDEWNVWYRTAGSNTGSPPNLLEEVYDLADALVVGMHLNAFVRHAATVRMANLAQLVNVIAPIVTTPDGLVRQTIYHSFALFSRTVGRVALDAWWDGDTVSGGAHGALRALDVSASIEPDARKLAIHVVNRGDEPAETSIELAQGGLGRGSVEVSVVTGPSLAATNTVERPDAVATSTRFVDAPASPDGHVRHVFEPRSVTSLVFSI
jgi:alpha-N-arabinofuranosidase